MNLRQKFERCLELKGEYIHIKKDASYYTEVKDGTLYIYFEWSNGRLDWLHNLNFPAKPYRRMKKIWFVHRGFLSVWKMIEPVLMPLIIDTQIERIEIVGYSHGAAIALLCYEYCAFHRSDIVVSGTGFGCPRVFWGPCSKKVRDRFKHFTIVRNGDDIVTHVPPRCLGFIHIAKIEQIGTPILTRLGRILDHADDAYLETLEVLYDNEDSTV